MAKKEKVRLTLSSIRKMCQDDKMSDQQIADYFGLKKKDIYDIRMEHGIKKPKVFEKRYELILEEEDTTEEAQSVQEVQEDQVVEENPVVEEVQSVETTQGQNGSWFG